MDCMIEPGLKPHRRRNTTLSTGLPTARAMCAGLPTPHMVDRRSPLSALRAKEGDLRSAIGRGQKTCAQRAHGAILSVLVVVMTSCTATAAEISFNRDIRPILSDVCFKCHGPDAKARKEKLRLDDRESAIARRKHGRAIVPGDARSSVLVQKIRHVDPKKRMPPIASGKTLTEREKTLLELW
ncbi:MAG TPA: hypothetical protein EYQ63_03285, partial [Fuerstia sp.]|nr:hypothetical protein [Fuerstiella sp.]